MNTIANSVIICMLITLCGIADGEEIKYLDAPKIVPGSTEEMQHPEFWISNIKGDPDRVFMTPEQIIELNKKNQTKSYTFEDVNGKIHKRRNENTILICDPLSIKTFSGKKVRTFLERNSNFLESSIFYDFRKRTWDEDMKNALYDKINSNSVSDVITPRYGILVIHTENRKFPTDKRAWDEQNGWIPSFGNTSLDLGMPVAVLHESKDRDWYFVRSEIHFGWVPAVNVAIGQQEKLKDYVHASDFIVSCTYKVPVYSDNGSKDFLADLYMGARLKLVKQTRDGYHVLVPFRGPDGSFDVVPGWVKSNAHVSVCYQPFTQRNVINTFFTVLYRPWAGGDSYHERMCSGGIRAVLRTFDIIVMSSDFQLYSSDHVIIFPKETPRETKYKFLDKCEPGITIIGSRDHVILYLGKIKDNYYVIHQTGYDYKADDNTVMMVRRVNVNDSLLPGGSHVDTWTNYCVLKP